MATEPRRADRTVLITGLVLGVALMGAVDEIVFHQLLQWHHFYLDTTPFWQIFSDGLFHLFTTGLWLVAALLLWYRRRELAGLASDRAFWGAVLLGMGGFQLFDGTINHIVLGLHPVRVGAEPRWPYDLGWNLAALALLAEGWILRRAARPRRAARAEP